TGSGPITVGPIPLPQVNLKNKIKIAQMVTKGSLLENKINLKLLEDSRQVIGSEINPLKAQLIINGSTIALKPYHMANGHFRASGDATVFKQKSIESKGTFTLNRRVTEELILDPSLRKILTEGKNELSLPFSLSGPVEDPQVSVDSSHLQQRMVLASAELLKQQTLNALKPPSAVKEATKKGPLKKAKESLSNIFKRNKK
ncbi:MAG: hypothetical protein KDK66_06845, partial [Deltaproteobacteria bacterium]|nr:hypothetical protein [Deltaproteobacteria bacterium]